MPRFAVMAADGRDRTPEQNRRQGHVAVEIRARVHIFSDFNPAHKRPGIRSASSPGRNQLCNQADNTYCKQRSHGVHTALTIDRLSALAYIRPFPGVQPFRSKIVIAELRSFPGVSCLRCGNPIPVSATIVDIQDDISNGGTDVPYAFRIRCRICEYETIYEVGKVQTFDGEPRKRGTRKRAA